MGAWVVAQTIAALHRSNNPVRSLSIRPALAADYKAFARLFDELETGDPTPDIGVFNDHMLGDTLIATDASCEVAGYAYWQIFGGACYVRQLVTSPAHRRLGVARGLLDRIATAGRERGATRWQLNVKLGNEPALRLYESLGFARTYETIVLRLPWANIAA